MKKNEINNIINVIYYRDARVWNMKLLILDFDGTIADTKSSIVNTIQATGKELGYGIAREKDIQENRAAS